MNSPAHPTLQAAMARVLAVTGTAINDVFTRLAAGQAASRVLLDFA